MFATDIHEEHWLRPHSDERPGLPRRDVPPDQTPGSHHAPVTVASYSSAHHPQGTGQGRLLSHINISFHTASIHTRIETCRLQVNLSLSLCSSVLLSVFDSAQNLQRWNSLLFYSEKCTYNCAQKTSDTCSKRALFPLMLCCCFRFLKLLRSPGKDCPRFRALMTETFESEHYQRFLRAHQVRQTTEEDRLRKTLHCNLFNDAVLTAHFVLNITLLWVMCLLTTEKRVCFPVVFYIIRII